MWGELGECGEGRGEGGGGGGESWVNVGRGEEVGRGYKE